MTGERVVVGLSGGVDSAVAALLLQRQGLEVIGLHLALPPAIPGLPECGARAAAVAAARVARALGIELRRAVVTARFRRRVLAPFARGYAAGETPNPCAACNPEVKWPALLAAARRADAAWVATGHYARIEHPAGRPAVLARGVDGLREQSYFLARLGPAALARTRLPLGELTKIEVRALARAAGLPSAERAGSMETCFAPPGRHPEVIEALLGAGAAPPPGALVDAAGRELGHHRGVHRFTIGQRRGLGLAAPRPLYVLAKDAARAEVKVGPAEALRSDRFALREVVWTEGRAPALPLAIQVKIRYRTPPLGATLRTGPEGLEVALEQPATGVAPGQAAVFYRGERVLGSAWIASSTSSTACSTRSHR